MGSRLIQLPLTRREIRLLITWSQTKEPFPDEDRVRRKLQAALDQEVALRLSRVQIQILHGWSEKWWGTHYGGGKVVNPDEEAILLKIRSALGWD